MALTVSCPSCHKTLRLSEDSQGKKMRCPACQLVFKAPELPRNKEDPDPPPDEPANGVAKDEQEPEPERREDEMPPWKRPVRVESEDRPSRRSRDDEDDRPSRHSREDDYEDYDRRSRRDDDYDRPSRRVRDDYDDRPRRRRYYDDDHDRYSQDGGNAPKVLGILSIVFCLPICIFLGLVGFILGLIAVIMASSELGSIPPRERHSPRAKNLQLGRTLGTVGMCLSVGLFLLVCLWQMFFTGAQMGRF
jgi:hypothetical protein